MVVLDGASPPRVGNGRFVLVNTAPGDVPIEVLGRLESPTIMDWDRTHPIMRQIDFAKVAIEEAMRVRPLAPGKTLVEAQGGPLIYLLEEMPVDDVLLIECHQAAGGARGLVGVKKPLDAHRAGEVFRGSWLRWLGVRTGHCYLLSGCHSG